MARVITPSGDEVRTVYSSGGFAAGDYVFQTASGFEKTTVNAIWPVSPNSSWINGALGNIGMGFSPVTDYLLGPSQIGGTYSGASISTGSTIIPSKAISWYPADYTKVVRLSSGNILLCRWTGGSVMYFDIYDKTFTTLITTLSNAVGYNRNNFQALPDNSGGCFLYYQDSSYSIAEYLAETGTNTYSISGTTSDGGSASYSAQYGGATLIYDGYVSAPGYGGQLTYSKWTYSPRSNAAPQVTTFYAGSSFSPSTYGLGAFYIDGGILSDSLAGLKRLGTVSKNSSTTGVLYIDNNTQLTNSASATSSSATFQTTNSSDKIAAPTVVRTSANTSGRALIVPGFLGGQNYIYFNVAEMSSSGSFHMTGTSFKTGNLTLSGVMSSNNSSLYGMSLNPITNPYVNNPDLLLTYVRTDPGTGGPIVCARVISGALAAGVVPTSSAEILLNATVPIYTPSYSPIFWDKFANTLFGTAMTSGSAISIEGKAGAALVTPTAFAYGSTLTPSQTGTCVGVALTAASAGGTGKILVRGTAEVRSTLPNMPGSLSFNHTNYGPGGIRGSVAGRTVTFEGIDG